MHKRTVFNVRLTEGSLYNRFGVILGVGAKIFGGKVHSSSELRVFRHLWSRSDAPCSSIKYQGRNHWGVRGSGPPTFWRTPNFWHNVCVGGSTVKPAEWIWCISLYSNCDSSTIRVRFEHDSSTACYNTLRGFSCARIRVRYEHHTMRKRHPECAKTKLCFVTKFGPGRLAVVSCSLPQR